MLLRASSELVPDQTPLNLPSTYQCSTDTSPACRQETAGSVTPAGTPAATTTAAKQTAKDQLEAQIATRQKLLKLLRKKAAANDAAVKAKLQLRINQLQAQAGLQPAATPSVPTTAAAVQPIKLLGQAMSTSPGHHKQQQPLLGITGVLANTPVEQVRRLTLQHTSCWKCVCLLGYVACEWCCMEDMMHISSQALSMYGECMSGMFACCLVPCVPTLLLQARRAERQQRFAADLVAAKSINTSSSTAGKAGVAGGVVAAQAGIGEPSSWLRLEGGCGTNRWAGGGRLSSICRGCPLP